MMRKKASDFKKSITLPNSGAPYLILVVFFIVAYSSYLFNYAYPFLKTTNVDLPSFWTAARATFIQGRSPYNPDLLKSIIPGGQQVFPYLYPPPSLLLFSPMTLMSYAQARVLMLGLNHALVLFVLWFVPIKMLRLSAKRDTALIILLSFYLFSFYPLIVLFFHGQINLILAALLYLFWYSTRRDRTISAAFFLALSILLKTYPLLILPFLILTKKYKVVGYTLGILGVVTIAAYLVLPSQVWADWFGRILPTGGYTKIPDGLFLSTATTNLSFNGVISRYFLQGKRNAPNIAALLTTARVITYALSASAGLLSMFTVWRLMRKNEAVAFEWMMLIMLPLMFLVSPFSWEHHLVYLLATIFILIERLINGSFHLPVAVIIAGAAMILAINGFTPLKFLSVLGLWGVSIFMALRHSDWLEDRQNYLEP